ncbi:sigma factor-like helix-turn-helix DNA-binding protein [Actinopolymorpha alba]|uniref:sigma factor-like helix-turn-helix DNA-binding protein n=1 Tax=Actinopolymorpha alba TaxID=533267 RepID=UPI000A02E4E9|nr:sigma factor-like helix-turn-helix DNA-binding protein [Actinopolymorpha alba]
MDPERREALVLTQVLGLSYAEVAEICGCPIGTVRSRIARARDDLLRADGQREAGAS